MLSRTADHLYWMARYTERAENTVEVLASQLRESQERLTQIEEQLRVKKERYMGRLPDQIDAIEALHHPETAEPYGGTERGKAEIDLAVRLVGDRPDDFADVGDALRRRETQPLIRLRRRFVFRTERGAGYRLEPADGEG